MVKFNVFDFHLQDIQRESKLSNLKTRRDYKVFGLASASQNPAIMIMVRGDIKSPKSLVKFLCANGIYTVFQKAANAPENSPYHVKIGLRKDLREHTQLCVSCLKSVVYNMEHRLKIPKGYVIPGVPKMPGAGEKAKPKPPNHEGDYEGQWAGADNCAWRWNAKEWILMEISLEPQALKW